LADSFKPFDRRASEPRRIHLKRRRIYSYLWAVLADGCTETRTLTRWSRRLRIVISRSTVKRSSWALRMREKSAAAMPVIACASHSVSLLDYEHETPYMCF
jgi:hypothetical protein